MVSHRSGSSAASSSSRNLAWTPRYQLHVGLSDDHTGAVAGGQSPVSRVWCICTPWSGRRDDMLPGVNFPQLLHTYFTDWLGGQRHLSRPTMLSHCDARRLFLRFVAQRHRRRVAAITFDQLTAEEVLAFLHHLE